MDRNLILKILNGEERELSKILSVVSEYCIEEGKDPKHVDTLIKMLSSNPLIIGNCLSKALDYYTIKYSINIVKDKEGNIITHF